MIILAQCGWVLRLGTRVVERAIMTRAKVLVLPSDHPAASMWQTQSQPYRGALTLSPPCPILSLCRPSWTLLIPSSAPLNGWRVHGQIQFCVRSCCLTTNGRWLGLRSSTLTGSLIRKQPKSLCPLLHAPSLHLFLSHAALPSTYCALIVALALGLSTGCGHLFA